MWYTLSLCQPAFQTHVRRFPTAQTQPRFNGPSGWRTESGRQIGIAVIQNTTKTLKYAGQKGRRQTLNTQNSPQECVGVKYCHKECVRRSAWCSGCWSRATSGLCSRITASDAILQQLQTECQLSLSVTAALHSPEQRKEASSLLTLQLPPAQLSHQQLHWESPWEGRATSSSESYKAHTGTGHEATHM